MTISASRLQWFLNVYLKYFLCVLLVGVILVTITHSERTLFDTMFQFDYYYLAIIAMCSTIAEFGFSNPNVEVHDNWIGTAKFTGFGSSRQQFVDLNKIDMERSTTRSVLDKLFGSYSIYDQSGNRLRFNSRYFNKAGLQQIFDVLEQKGGLRVG